MARKQERDRANLGEQTDMTRTDIERQDRSMGADSQGDSRAGSEGIEEPVRERSTREGVQRESSERSGRASSSDFSRAARRTRKQGRQQEAENG